MSGTAWFIEPFTQNIGLSILLVIVLIALLLTVIVLIRIRNRPKTAELVVEIRTPEEKPKHTDRSDAEVITATTLLELARNIDANPEAHEELFARHSHAVLVACSLHYIDQLSSSLIVLQQEEIDAGHEHVVAGVIVSSEKELAIAEQRTKATRAKLVAAIKTAQEILKERN